MTTAAGSPADAPLPAASAVTLSPEGFDPNSDAHVKIRGRLRRLLISMALGNLGIFLIWGAIPGVMLALQVQELDPARKAANLAVTLTISSFVAMLAQPVAGMLSDRTRNRLGRRAPWMLLGAFCGGLALIGLAFSNTLVWITIAWVLAELSYNFAQGPMSAILPDRVPRGVRGTFASLAALGFLAGGYGGPIIGASFADHLRAGYFFFAGLVLLIMVLFAVISPDHPSTGLRRAPLSLATFARTFWVSPRAHPDFFWGFTGRLLLFVSYFLVSTYQLYILQDYIGLGADAVRFIPVLALVGLGGNIVAVLIGGPVSDRVGRRKPIAIAAGLLYALAMLFPWVLPTTTGMLFAAAILGLGFGTYLSVDGALMSEVLPSSDDFGKDLGVLNIAATLPQIIAPWVVTLIVAIFGGYTLLFPVAMVIALVGAAAIIPIKSVR